MFTQGLIQQSSLLNQQSFIYPNYKQIDQIVKLQIAIPIIFFINKFKKVQGNFSTKSETEFNIFYDIIKRFAQQYFPMNNSILMNQIFSSLQDYIVIKDKQRIQKIYDYPANVKVALLHKEANMFGYVPKLSIQKSQQQVKICPCCELNINRKDVDLSYQTTPDLIFNKSIMPQFYHLKAGTSLFFTFIKMTILYTLLRFLITDAFNLTTNILADNCNNSDNFQFCRSNITSKFSSYNKNTQTDSIKFLFMDILNFITVIISIVFFNKYRNYQFNTYRYASKSNHSQSDYTIFVEQIPIIYLNETDKKSLAPCCYKDRLTQFFSKKIKQWRAKIQQMIDSQKSNYTNAKKKMNKLQLAYQQLRQSYPEYTREEPTVVKSITLCYDLNQLEKLNNQREKLMTKHKSSKQHQSYANSKEEEKAEEDYFLNKINGLNGQIMQLTKKYSQEQSAQFNTSHFLGKAFISFQFEHYRQYFLEYLKQDLSFNKLDENLKISAADEPSDIYWYNLAVPKNQRNISILVTSVCMAVLLAMSFGLLLGLQYLKK